MPTPPTRPSRTRFVVERQLERTLRIRSRDDAPAARGSATTVFSPSALLSTMRMDSELAPQPGTRVPRVHRGSPSGMIP